MFIPPDLIVSMKEKAFKYPFSISYYTLDFDAYATSSTAMGSPLAFGNGFL
jgi:hypothetical protein